MDTLFGKLTSLQNKQNVCSTPTKSNCRLPMAIYIHKRQVCRRLWQQNDWSSHFVDQWSTYFSLQQLSLPMHPVFTTIGANRPFFLYTAIYIVVWPFVIVRHEALYLLMVAKFSHSLRFILLLMWVWHLNRRLISNLWIWLYSWHGLKHNYGAYLQLSKYPFLMFVAAAVLISTWQQSQYSKFCTLVSSTYLWGTSAV